jgi:hypothetical protein
MIRKCGKDSKIPLIMAVDALAAGIDTTGNTGAEKNLQLVPFLFEEDKIDWQLIQKTHIET